MGKIALNERPFSEAFICNPMSSIGRKLDAVMGRNTVGLLCGPTQ